MIYARSTHHQDRLGALCSQGDHPAFARTAKDATAWAIKARMAIGMAESDGLCTQIEATQAKNQITLWLELDQRVQFPL